MQPLYIQEPGEKTIGDPYYMRQFTGAKSRSVARYDTYHYSKTYGINRKSALLDVAHFPFFNGGLPHDCMHDILEGAASTEVKLVYTEALYCSEIFHLGRVQ